MEGIQSNGHSESAIPDKSLFRIGEVSRVTSTKPFVLRYWETEFPMLQPVKSPKGHRLYRREDIETVFTIKRLLYDEGFTIAARGATCAIKRSGGTARTAARPLRKPKTTAENPRRKRCRRRLHRSTARPCSTCATRSAPY